MAKKCTKCGEFKDKSLFNKDRQKKDGLSSSCKDCIHLKYLSRKEHYIRKAAKSYIENKEHRLNQLKEYYKKNKDKIDKKNKKYHKENKERVKALALKYHHRKFKSDELYRLKHSLRGLINQALRGQKKGKTEQIIGCSFDYFKRHIENQFEDWMNWDNKGLYNGEKNHGWDIDHIKPLSSAKTKEETIKLNHYTNLRPLCSYVNRVVKKDKYEQKNIK